MIRTRASSSERLCSGWDGVAITNELFLCIAARLHLRCGRYDGDARRAWEWFARSGLVNERNLVNDGLRADCRNNGGVE
jgi:hypothetical protein